MALIPVSAQSGFDYTNESSTVTTLSSEITFYAGGESIPTLTEVVGNGTAPYAYPINSNILLTYTFTPSTTAAFTGLTNIELVNAGFNGAILVPQNGTVSISYNNGTNDVSASQNFTIATATTTMTIPITDTGLQAYDSTFGPLTISFNVQSASTQLTALSANTTMTLTVNTATPVKLPVTTSTITGAAQINIVAIMVELTSPQAGMFIFNGGTVSYTVKISYVKDSAPSTIRIGENILPAPEGLNFTSVSNTSFTVTENSLVTDEEITVSSTSNLHEVTVTGTYTAD